MIDDKILNVFGSKSGLRLLLNAVQNEHCDSGRKYEGAGFQATVHDPELMRPLFALASSFTLSPGFEFQVLIKPTVFRRKTESLGLCNSTIDVFTEKRAYFQSTCLQVCLAKHIFKHCRCYVLSNMKKHMMKYYYSTYGDSVSKIPVCGSPNIGCMKIQEYRTYRADNLKLNCPECLQPCFETKYNILVSQQTFPSNNMAGYLKTYFNKSDLTDVRKNYMLLNLYTESMTVLTVVEQQSYTITDFFVYVGFTIGLFLGMSFMSMGDLVHFFMFCVFHMGKAFHHWKINKVVPLQNSFIGHRRTSRETTRKIKQSNIKMFERNQRAHLKRNMQNRQILKKLDVTVTQF